MYRKIIHLQYFWTIFVESPIKTLFYHFLVYKHCYTLLMSLTVSKAITGRISRGCDFGHFKKKKTTNKTLKQMQNKTKQKTNRVWVGCHVCMVSNVNNLPKCFISEWPILRFCVKKESKNHFTL